MVPCSRNWRAEGSAVWCSGQRIAVSTGTTARPWRCWRLVEAMRAAGFEGGLQLGPAGPGGSRAAASSHAPTGRSGGVRPGWAWTWVRRASSSASSLPRAWILASVSFRGLVTAAFWRSRSSSSRMAAVCWTLWVDCFKRPWRDLRASRPVSVHHPASPPWRWHRPVPWRQFLGVW